MNDPTMFAAGFLTAVAVVSVIAMPLFEDGRRALHRARETLQKSSGLITSLEQDIEHLLQASPRRLPNGRFAKRQENNHG